MDGRQPLHKEDPRRRQPIDEYHNQGYYQNHGPPSDYRNQPGHPYQQQQLQHNNSQQQWAQQYPQHHPPQRPSAIAQSAFSSAMNPSLERPQYSRGPDASSHFSADNQYEQQYQQSMLQSHGAPPPRHFPSSFHPTPPAQQQQTPWRQEQYQQDRERNNYPPIDEYAPPVDPRVAKWAVAAAATTAELPARYATREASPQMPLTTLQRTAGTSLTESPAWSQRDARRDAPHPPTQMLPTTAGSTRQETLQQPAGKQPNATIQLDRRRNPPPTQQPQMTEGSARTEKQPIAPGAEVTLQPHDGKRDAPRNAPLTPALTVPKPVDRQYDLPPSTDAPKPQVDVSDYPTSQFKMAFQMYQKRGHNLEKDWGKELIHRSHIRITDDTAIASNDKHSLPQHHHFIAFCKYNPVHVMDSLEITHHEELCPDRKVIELLLAL